MTKPSTREPLYLTEGQIAARFEISAEEWKAIAAVLEKSGLPRRDPLFGNRRYWPAIREFLDRRAGVWKDGPLCLDGEEHWDEPPSRRARRKAAPPGGPP